MRNRHKKDLPSFTKQTIESTPDHRNHVSFQDRIQQLIRAHSVTKWASNKVSKFCAIKCQFATKAYKIYIF